MNAGLGTTVIGSRYRIIRELGQGSFGQTFLAEDIHRFNELCVLKEFAPDRIESNPEVIAQARAQFEQEANALYQIQHSQVPQFRELLQIATEPEGYELFLVQDYIEGLNYRELLQSRQRYGGHFSETEIVQLLYQVLPVLDYLHSLGIVHRDIAPENLVLRNSDGLCVLVDLAVGKTVGQGVGTVGYTPPEQFQTGAIGPDTDLYSLAATVLHLATGQDPQAFYDDHLDAYGEQYQGGWNWADVHQLSPGLLAILGKMLALNPHERYASATAVMQALKVYMEAPAAATPKAATSVSAAEVANFRAALHATTDPVVPPSLDLAFDPTLGAAMSDPALTGDLELIDPETSDLPLDFNPNIGFYPDAPDATVDLEASYGEATELAMAQTPQAAPPTLPQDVDTLVLNDAPRMSGATGAPVAPVPTAPAPELTSSSATLVGQRPMEPVPSAYTPSEEASPQSGCWQAALGLLAILGLAGLLFGLYLGTGPIFRRGTVVGERVEGNLDENRVERVQLDVSNLDDEATRKAIIQQRRTALGIEEAFFAKLVDQVFYRRYTNLQGRALTNSKEDAPLRYRWDNTASDMLDLLEKNLSQRVMRTLGSYSSRDRNTWATTVSRLNVSDRALYDLADVKFNRLFPNQLNDTDFLAQPIGQIWYGLTDDRVRDLEGGTILENIEFAPGTYGQQLSGQLNPGEGQVITLQLSQDQILRLRLQANANTTLLSLYVPKPDQTTPFLLSDSTSTSWSGQLPQSGFYEIVVVSKANEPIAYQLDVAVDNVRSAPKPTVESTPTTAPAPASTPGNTTGNSGDTFIEAQPSPSPSPGSPGSGLQF
jgi:serine/threonine protein kinase